MRPLVEPLEQLLCLTAGIVDPEFGSGGIHVGDIGVINAMVIQQDGKLVVGGDTEFSGFIARYKEDGSLDPTFGDGGIVTPFGGGSIFDESSVTDLAIMDDGRIVACGGGDAGPHDIDGFGFVVMFSSNGTVQRTRSADDGLFAHGLTSIVVLPDGTFAVGGFREMFRYDTRLHGIPILGGASSVSFGDDGSNGGSLVGMQIIGAKGKEKIIATNGPQILKFDANGVLDTGFNGTGRLDLGFDAVDLAVDPKGRIIAGGNIKHPGPSSNNDFAAVRILANGAVDASFNHGNIFEQAFNSSARVGSIAIQTDGKIVVAGSFENANGKFVVQRLSVDGTPDPSFGSKGAAITDVQGTTLTEQANAIVLGADGSAFVGGGKADFDSNPVDVLVKYTPDDLYFNSETAGLYVRGSGKADSIVISPAGGVIQVAIHGKVFSAIQPAINRVRTVSVDAGDGDDVVAVQLPVNAIVSGGAGSDRVTGGDGDDTLTGGKGNDTLFGGGGYDLLNGSSGNDFLYGGGNADALYGGFGNDYLQGDGASDKIYGEAGSDTMVGGKGADLLNGGLDLDVARFVESLDTVLFAEIINGKPA